MRFAPVTHRRQDCGRLPDGNPRLLKATYHHMFKLREPTQIVAESVNRSSWRTKLAASQRTFSDYQSSFAILYQTTKSLSILFTSD